jgi:hypothetical protein
MELTSLRSNQFFIVDYKSNKLIPQTEVILLVEKPIYKSKAEKIIRSTEIQELRFTLGSQGIRAVIGMLEEALKVTDNYEKMGGAINNIIASQEK